MSLDNSTGGRQTQHSPLLLGREEGFEDECLSLQAHPASGVANRLHRVRDGADAYGPEGVTLIPLDDKGTPRPRHVPLAAQHIVLR